MTIRELNALGNLVNTTWGSYSSPKGDCSITCSLAGNTLTLKYSTIVHFASETSLRDQVVRCSEEGQQRLSDYLNRLKKDFKDATGTSLKFSNEINADDVELIQANARAPRKVAYYRMNKTVTLS